MSRLCQPTREVKSDNLNAVLASYRTRAEFANIIKLANQNPSLLS